MYVVATIVCCGLAVGSHLPWPFRHSNGSRLPRRQLTHRSFASPKLVEYFLAFLGTLGGEMVSEECDRGGWACGEGRRGGGARGAGGQGVHARNGLAPYSGRKQTLMLWSAALHTARQLGSRLTAFTLHCPTPPWQDPIDWVRHHRYHHRNCDSPLDPHSEQLPQRRSHSSCQSSVHARACRTAGAVGIP